MARNSANIALFDFCETLISFQTADQYVNYCLSHSPSLHQHLRHLLLRFLEKGKFFNILKYVSPQQPWHKRFVLWQIKGMSEMMCKKMAIQYLEEELIPNIIAPIFNKLEDHLQQGDEVWIISGGYDIYIDAFVKKFNLNGSISNHLSFINGLCTGKWDGLDCMNENKTTLVNKVNLQNYTKQFFYSDSQSDLPLLNIVSDPIVVSNKKSQDWAKQKNMEEIIWI